MAAIYPGDLSTTRGLAPYIAGANADSEACPSTPTDAYATSVIVDSPDAFYQLNDFSAAERIGRRI